MNKFTHKMHKPVLAISLFQLVFAAFAAQAQFSGGPGSGNSRINSSSSTQKGETNLAIWRGGQPGSETDWANSSNWVSQTLPAAGDIITLEPNGNEHTLILDQNRTLYTLHLNWSQKKVQLGAHTLTMEGELVGADAGSYIQTTGTGTVKKTLGGAVSFPFPVGNSSYNPLTITNNTGTADDFSVRVADAVFVNGHNGQAHGGARVDVTWYISKTNPTANAGDGVDFIFQWHPSQEKGGIQQFALNHHNGAGWTFANSSGGTQSFTNGNPRTLTFTGYKGTFSPFALGNSGSTLPVTWLSFTGRPAGQEVQLEWKTASEQNSSHFDVERSNNGTAFTPIGRVSAAGNSQEERSYTFRDRQPLHGASFYRLRQVDLDGTFSYSKVITMNMSVLSKVWVGPSPTAGPLTLRVPTDWQGVYEWRLHDAKGIVVMRGNGLRAGTHTIDLQHLAGGMYQLSFWEKGRLVQQQWVVRQ